MEESDGLLQRKKGKALLIALANINLVFAAHAVWPERISPEMTTAMLSAISALSGAFVGFQGLVDFAASWRQKSPST